MNQSTSSQPSGYGIMPVLGSSVLIVACLYWLREILIPLTCAVLLAFILSPLVIRLQRYGVRKGLAVFIVVLVTFAFLGGLCWGVTAQLRNLLSEIPQHRNEITTKLKNLQSMGLGPVAKFVDMWNDVNSRLRGEEPTQNVEQGAPPKIVAANSSSPNWYWVAGAVGTGLQFLVNAFFIALLVVFMLAQREDLRDRFFRAVGHGQLAAMTRMVDEAAERISSYLMAQLFLNLAFGALWAICLLILPTGGDEYGLPYALLWGSLAAALRFVPYLGTWVALALPLLLSMAISPINHPWLQPLLMIGIYLVMELVTANVLEPLVYGRNAGVAPVALLIAAVFWTWMWGPIGLVLSTPLTVCLVVLGKYVPGMGLLQVFLGDESSEVTETKYYQRLLAGDEDEATELVQVHLKERPPETVYDDMLIPALILARRDRERGGLQPHVEAFIVEVTGRVVEEIAANEPRGNQQGSEALPSPASKVLVLGCPAHGALDELALHMLAQLLQAANCSMELLSTKALTSEVVKKVREEEPAAVCIASLPPGGQAQAGYLCKRLRWNFPELKIIVGRWGQTENVEKTRTRLQEAGATLVLTSLLETRREIIPLAHLSTTVALRPTEEPAVAVR